MVEFDVDVNLNLGAAGEVDDAIDKASEDVGDFLTGYAKAIAPVDTGTFMRTIDWEKIDSATIVIGSSDRPGKVKALEGGHSDQAPTGVFGPTVRRNKEKIKAIYRKAIIREVNI